MSSVRRSHFVLPKKLDFMEAKHNFKLTQQSIDLFEAGRPGQGYVGLLDLTNGDIHLLPAFNLEDGLLHVNKEKKPFKDGMFVESTQVIGTNTGDIHWQAAVKLKLGHKQGINGLLIGFGLWKSGSAFKLLFKRPKFLAYVPDEYALIKDQRLGWQLKYVDLNLQENDLAIPSILKIWTDKVDEDERRILEVIKRLSSEEKKDADKEKKVNIEFLKRQEHLDVSDQFIFVKKYKNVSRDKKESLRKKEWLLYRKVDDENYKSISIDTVKELQELLDQREILLQKVRDKFESFFQISSDAKVKFFKNRSSSQNTNSCKFTDEYLLHFKYQISSAAVVREAPLEIFSNIINHSLRDLNIATMTATGKLSYMIDPMIESHLKLEEEWLKDPVAALSDTFNSLLQSEDDIEYILELLRKPSELSFDALFYGLDKFPKENLKILLDKLLDDPVELALYVKRKYPVEKQLLKMFDIARIADEVDEMCKLLIEGQLVNKDGFRGVNPIVEVAKENANDVVDFLASQGVDLNYENKEGRNALSYAVENDNAGMVGLLLSRGASIDRNAQEVLSFLIKKKELKLASDAFHKLSLEKQTIVINELFNQYKSRKLNATERLNFHSFIENYAHLLNPYNGCVFYIKTMFESNNPNVLQKLNRDAINSCGATGETVLIDTIKSGGMEKPALVQKLLESKADPNTPDQNGLTPIHHILQLNNVKALQFFIKNGADPFKNFDRLDEYNKLKLAYMVGSATGDFEAIKPYLKNLDINTKSPQGYSLYYESLIKSWPRMTQQLELNKADLNVGFEKYFPLDFYIANKNTDKVESLLKNKVTQFSISSAKDLYQLVLSDIENDYKEDQDQKINLLFSVIQEKKGLAQQELVMEFFRQLEVDALAFRGVELPSSYYKIFDGMMDYIENLETIDKIDVMIRSAIIFNNTKELSFLVTEFPLVDINKKNKEGDVLICKYLIDRAIDVVKVLLEMKANPLELGSDGNNALHFLAAQSMPDEAMMNVIFKHINENKLDVNVKNGEGRTAAHLAAIMSNSDCLYELARSGADFTLKDQDQSTPFSYLITNEKWDECIKLLLILPDLPDDDFIKKNREKIINVFRLQLQQAESNTKDTYQELDAVLNGKNALGKLIGQDKPEVYSGPTLFAGSKEKEEKSVVKTICEEIADKMQLIRTLDQDLG